MKLISCLKGIKTLSGFATVLHIPPLKQTVNACVMICKLCLQKNEGILKALDDVK